jgi:pimeloyl-ACP methyl ester carboxylesterase
MPQFTAADGASLYFTDEGAGLPVLCLAGLTRNSGDFDFIAAHLSDVRLIRMDYRGRGASDRTGPATYTIVQEARDAIALLDHLGIGRAAILGTSRGGLIGMLLALTARDRLAGLCLNDIGPVMEKDGLEGILTYIGRNPTAPSFAVLAEHLPEVMPGFAGVPPDRWLAFAERLYEETPDGLRIRYDPALRDAVVTAFAMPELDLWPMFDACAGLPLALVRGANSDLLSRATADEMKRRRPDMILAEVPGRGHVPFLDEPESITAITAWLDLLA